MRRFWLVLLMIAMVAATAVFATPAMASDCLPSVITSYKWYDADADGIDDYPDPSEPGIPGWKIELLKDGVVIQTVYTDAQGWYRFAPVMPGTYVVREADGGGNWLQTSPLDPNYYTVVVTGDGATFRCQTPFGNVCRQFVCGFTPGFWGNKNGLAAMKAYAGVLPLGRTAEQWQAYFREGSTAVDMGDKLMWHYWAYWMNTHVKGIDYDGAKIFIDGKLYDVDTLLAGFSGGPTGDREVDELYKDLFDGLNNRGGYVYLPYCECKLPVW